MTESTDGHDAFRVQIDDPVIAYAAYHRFRELLEAAVNHGDTAAAYYDDVVTAFEAAWMTSGHFQPSSVAVSIPAPIGDAVRGEFVVEGEVVTPVYEYVVAECFEG